MLEAHHYTAAAKKKGSYALPEEFDGTVNQPALYHAVRAYLNNQRHGTADTKTRGEVSGGNQKPWKQKGTGRARQGSSRSPNWPGGGKVFGPTPRKYRTNLPRKVKRLARQSAFNARASEGRIHVIEALDFPAPKTSRMAEILEQLELTGQKVLVLTHEAQLNVHLSGRNIPGVRVTRFGDVSAYDLMWADGVVVEEAALGGTVIVGKAPKATTREKKVKKAAAKKAAAKKPAPTAAAMKPAAKKPKAKSAAKPKKNKEGGNG
ncbi:MAG: 50S ribosomal protein L4 [Gemmatimonadetes bacterium]|nr:50S ribosomal protein L4 [Gemmatimonadota bacterium]